MFLLSIHEIAVIHLPEMEKDLEYPPLKVVKIICLMYFRTFVGRWNLAIIAEK